MYFLQYLNHFIANGSILDSLFPSVSGIKGKRNRLVFNCIDQKDYDWFSYSFIYPLCIIHYYGIDYAFILLSCSNYWKKTIDGMIILAYYISLVILL